MRLPAPPVAIAGVSARTRCRGVRGGELCWERGGGSVIRRDARLVSEEIAGGCNFRVDSRMTRACGCVAAVFCYVRGLRKAVRG